jgi:hypothetical protein
LTGFAINRELTAVLFDNCFGQAQSHTCMLTVGGDPGMENLLDRG